MAKNNEILLYVMDHADREFSTEVEPVSKRAKRQVKVKASLKLEPVGANMLKGTGDFALTPETAVTIFVELPGQEPTAARFVPLKPKAKTAGQESCQTANLSWESNASYFEWLGIG